MMELITIDRIEGEYAVCELSNGEMVDIPIDLFTEKPSEGDIFNAEAFLIDGKRNYKILDKNALEMENRRKIILEKLRKIKK